MRYLPIGTQLAPFCASHPDFGKIVPRRTAEYTEHSRGVIYLLSMYDQQ